MKTKKEKAKNKTYAAIDVGSNAARLLVKQMKPGDGGTVKSVKLMMLRVPLRLGFDVFGSGKISPKKERDMIRLMKAYRHLMKIFGVDTYRACATSAMRDTKNGPDILRSIDKATGIKLEIIDGQEEAQMVYNNHIECMGDRDGNYVYVDVGGGSTEVNFLSGGQLVFSHSYNIGTVRTLCGVVRPEEWDTLRSDMERLDKAYSNIAIIGSGGNINKLYRLAPEKNKKDLSIKVATLRALYDELQPLSVAERMERFNLKSDRADVIVPAAEIFLTISTLLHIEDIYVPVIGLADGIIDALYAKDCGGGEPAAVEAGDDGDD